MGIPLLKIRRPVGRLIFNMGIAIPSKMVFLIETAPCSHARLARTILLSNTPDNKVHGANMGPIWGRQDPGGPHVDPMKFAIWDCIQMVALWRPANTACTTCSPLSTSVLPTFSWKFDTTLLTKAFYRFFTTNISPSHQKIGTTIFPSCGK